MTHAEIKKEIKRKFGTITRFIDLLGAPKQTIYGWTRSSHTKHPSAWLFRATIDAATYRSKRVAGWKCRGCGCVVEAINEAKRPRNCVSCGGKNFSPVSVIEETGKGE
ncbi:MAG: hypothetical protein ACN2B6_00095 [Rickettsiales bacterium]